MLGDAGDSCSWKLTAAPFHTPTPAHAPHRALRRARYDLGAPGAFVVSWRGVCWGRDIGDVSPTWTKLRDLYRIADGHGDLLVG